MLTRYLKGRRAYAVVSALAAVLLLSDAWAVYDTSAHHAVALGTPSRTIVPVLLARLVTTVLAVRTDAEATAVRRVGAYDACLVAVLLAVTALVALVLPLSGVAGATGLVRDTLLWTGVGLHSARLFGGGRAWQLPLIAQVPLQVWGSPGGGPWWALPLLPATPATWAVAGAVLAAGLASLAWTHRSARGRPHYPPCL